MNRSLRSHESGRDLQGKGENYGGGGNRTRATCPPLLDETDVSHDKLLDLERRLVAATRSGRVRWEREGNSYAYNAPHGVVDVSSDGVRIYDDRGRQLRRFRYETDALYLAARDWFNTIASDTVDRLLAELEAL